MNYELVFNIVGVVLRAELAFMGISLAVSYAYGGSDSNAFIISIMILTFACICLAAVKPTETKMRSRDGFMAAALSWIFISFFGALPFYFSGYFNSFADCFFESVSGFTTTGATILDRVEILPKGIMFWRCFSHWIGGMGVLVFVLAIMPNMSASSINLLRAESTGIAPSKMLPKLKETAKFLYLIYFVMTIITIACLKLAGMPFYDAMVNGFSIAGTGGFSNRNLSIGAYNSATIEMVASLFLFLFGVNYTLYFYMLRREFKQVIKDEELRFYAIVVILAILLIAADTIYVYDSIFSALRYSIFQVTSVITTAGMSSVDYNYWPTFSKLVIIFLMLTGCCAGSTGGGIKLVRILLLIKCAKIELHKILHPKVVKQITINNKPLDDKLMVRVFLFFFVYAALMMVSALIISLDNFDLVTTMTAVVTMISNVGPGLGRVGPMGSFSIFSSFSKFVLSFCMIAGRLELFPVLIIFMPSTWRKGM